MTPQEMHIQIDQALQRVSSYAYDNFEPVELDLVLSKMQTRYIDDKFRRDTTSEGFQAEQGDLDDIQFLIERDKGLPAILEVVSKKSYGVLPSDYLYLINDRTKVNENCNLDLTSSIPYIRENKAATSFPDSTAGAALYTDFELLIGSTVLIDSNLIANFPGVPDLLEKHIIRNFILDTIRQGIRENKYPGVTGIYYEDYRGEFHKERFILVTDDTRVGELFRVRVDGINTSTPVTLIPNLIVSDHSPTKEVTNRLTRSQFLPSVLNDNVYHRAQRRSPISNLAKDRLQVYYDEKYIPTEIIIDYIRKPREISLSLNQSCELSDSTHPKIIDLAVEYLKNTIEQQSYEYKVKDNMLRSE